MSAAKGGNIDPIFGEVGQLTSKDANKAGV